jgi:predicted Zn finger-like uncharacterized protein
MFYVCPHCGARREVGDDMLGKRVRCQECDTLDVVSLETAKAIPTEIDLTGLKAEPLPAPKPAPIPPPPKPKKIEDSHYHCPFCGTAQMPNFEARWTLLGRLFFFQFCFGVVVTFFWGAAAIIARYALSDAVFVGLTFWAGGCLLAMAFFWTLCLDDQRRCPGCKLWVN